MIFQFLIWALQGEKVRKELQAKLDVALDRATQAEEKVEDLTAELKSATRDLVLAAEAAASQKKVHEAQRAQAKAAEEAAVAKRNELENKLAETTKERDELRVAKAELERSLSVGERELAARLQQHAGEIEELKVGQDESVLLYTDRFS
jgi:chromosome segregation ATPase